MEDDNANFVRDVENMLAVKAVDPKVRRSMAKNEVMKMQRLIKWFGQGSVQDMEARMIDFRHMLFRKKGGVAMGRVMMGLEKYPFRTLKDLFDYTDASQGQDMFIHVLAFPDDGYTDFTNSFNTKTLFNIKQKNLPAPPPSIYQRSSWWTHVLTSVKANLTEEDVANNNWAKVLNFVEQAYSHYQFITLMLYDVYDYDNKTSTSVPCWKDASEPIAHLKHHFIRGDKATAVNQEVYTQIKFNLV